jgi:hypothetical protein
MTTPIINKIQFIYSLSQPDFGNAKIMENQRYDLHQNNIQLSEIHTEPQIVHVNDNFTIKATVINNSPSTIRFYSPICGEKPLSVEFNKNVVKHFKSPCIAMASLITLKPGEKQSIQSPGFLGVVFKAISAGLTNAVIVFHYGISQDYTQSSISSSFVFPILLSNGLS